MIIGGDRFDFEKHTYLMGILNITPDSFSDGGEYSDIDAALYHAKKMIDDGADIIDVGGESTRPGAKPVSAEDETDRVVPVIEKIKSEFNIPLSLDTYKADTALAGIKAGADMINDIWGLQYDPDMASVIASSDVVCCLMHNRQKHDYINFGEDLFTDMAGILNNAIRKGIKEDRIILDPGIGFKKTTEENLWILNNLNLLKHLGCPWLLGASRKSVIGDTLKLPVDERLEGTLGITALAVIEGAGIVRVHDVKENRRVINMMEAIKNA